MKRSFHEVLETARKHDVDMRVGAYVLAVARVAEATRLRGLFP
jgi:glutamate dehydrogenase (NAD(P)+)